jgi:hypothetical protein
MAVLVKYARQMLDIKKIRTQKTAGSDPAVILCGGSKSIIILK